MSTNAQAAMRTGAQALVNDATQSADQLHTGIRQLMRVPQAYDTAPQFGRQQGILYGIPAALLAGGLAYGGLSLLPWIRKKRGLKAALSLLAATAGGYAFGKPVAEKARDLYFESLTGVPSPWKPIKQNGKNTDVTPHEILTAYKDAWSKASKDPLGYFREQYAQHMREAYPNRGNFGPGDVWDSYKEVFEKAKANPMQYVADTLDNPEQNG